MYNSLKLLSNYLSYLFDAFFFHKIMKNYDLKVLIDYEILELTKKDYNFEENEISNRK